MAGGRSKPEHQGATYEEKEKEKRGGRRSAATGGTKGRRPSGRPPHQRRWSHTQAAAAVPGEGEWVRQTLTAPSLLFAGQAVVGQMGRTWAAIAAR
jgi:hypothetical protein